MLDKENLSRFSSAIISGDRKQIAFDSSSIGMRIAHHEKQILI